MQILRCLSLACATAMISSPLLLRADNEAQIRARAALEQKMDQMNTEPATATPPSTETNQPPAPAPAKPKKVKKAKPAPVEQPAPPPVQQPSVTESAPPVSTPPPPAPEPVRTREKAPAATANFAPAPATTDNTQTDERLQNALQQRMTETPAAPTEQQTPPTHSKQRNEVANNPPPAHPYNPPPQMQNPPASTLPALQGPPSPLSASKQQQLEALLQQYKADQITPQQYHEQRAKILGEP